MLPQTLDEVANTKNQAQDHTRKKRDRTLYAIKFQRNFSSMKTGCTN